MTRSETLTMAQVADEAQSRCLPLRDTEEDGHFAFLASAAFEADFIDAAEGGCPSPRLCAANGCRGLCPPPPAA